MNNKLGIFLLILGLIGIIGSSTLPMVSSEITPESIGRSIFLIVQIIMFILGISILVRNKIKQVKGR